MMKQAAAPCSRELFKKNCEYLSVVNAIPQYNTAMISSLEYNMAKLHETRFDGKYLYNRYSPLKEIEEQIEDISIQHADSILLCGMGIGIFIPLLKKRFPHMPIVVLELNEALFLTLLATHDFSDQEALNFIPILLRPTTSELLQYLQAIGSHTPHVLHTRLSLNFFKDDFQNICTKLAHYSTTNTINKNTLLQFSTVWKNNIIKNAYAHSDAMIELAAFKDAWRDMPAMLCAAGPSVDAHIETIRTAQHKMPLIAVDTVLPVLQTHGISPDIIVTVDPQFFNSQHFNWYTQESNAKTPLVVFDIACSHRSLRLCKKFSFFVVSSFISLGNFLLPDTHRRAKLQTGGTVAHVAWNFAFFTGITKLYTVGMDFCFWNTRTHSRYTQTELIPHLHNCRLNSREHDNYVKIHCANNVTITNYEGSAVRSNTQLATFASKFADVCSEQKAMKTFSFEPGGAGVAGITLISAKELLAQPDVKARFLQIKDGVCKNARCTSKREMLIRLTDYAASIAHIKKEIQNVLIQEKAVTEDIQAKGKVLEYILRSPFFESVEFFFQFENFKIKTEIEEEQEAELWQDSSLSKTTLLNPAAAAAATTYSQHKKTEQRERVYLHKITKFLQRLLHECNTLELPITRIMAEITEVQDSHENTRIVSLV